MTGVMANVGYLERNPLYAEEKPYQMTYKLRWIPEEDYRTTNMVINQQPVLVHNIRGVESKRTLDTNGFQVVQHQSKCDFKNRASIEGLYVTEMENLLKTTLGAAKVCIFHWRLRLAQEEHKGFSSTRDDAETLKYRTPVDYLHVDQTYNAGMEQIERVYQDHKDEIDPDLKAGRVQIINAWRPLISPLENWPLLVVDSRSVKPADLESVDLVRTRTQSESYYVYPNPDHRFEALLDMRDDEVMLMKMCDSEKTSSDGSPISQYCIHGSFENRSIAQGAVPRESIETRAVVFYG